MVFSAPPTKMSLFYGLAVMFFAPLIVSRFSVANRLSSSDRAGNALN
jgi:hypothetical protein